jgi:molecular chaperone GrpE
MAKKQDESQDVPAVEEFAKRIDELTEDLQRTRADFENYRKRVEQEKQMARMTGEATAVTKLLPVIDNIERAITHIPEDLADNSWAQGIAGLAKNLEKSLESMNVKRIDANPGTGFNPELHEAIQMDEDAEGEHEVIAEELQAGYTLHGQPLRTAMVKVTRQ